MKSSFLFKSVFRETLLVGAGFSALALIFFWTYFRQDYFFGDFIAFWLPAYKFVLVWLKAGQLPLWQPYSLLGVSGVFQPAYAIFYPPLWLPLLANILFNRELSLSVLGKSLELYLYFHLVIAAIGMYWFSKKSLGVGRTAAAIAAFVYAFSLTMTSSIADASGLLGKALLPGLMLCLVVYLNRPSFGNFCFLVLANFLLFTTGYPYFFIYFSAAQFLLALQYGLRLTFRLILAFGLAAGLAGFFLIPSLHIFAQSQRFQAPPPDFHTLASFPPSRIVSLIVPQLLGYYSPIGDPRQLLTAGNLAWGVFPTLLLVLGVLSSRRQAVNIWLIALLVLSLAYALGGYLDVPRLVGTVFPPILKLRSHSQSLILTFFAGCAFIASGAQRLLSTKTIPRLSTAFAYVFAFGLVLLSLVPLYCPFCLTVRSQILISFSRFLVLLGLAILLFCLVAKWRSRVLLLCALVITLFEYSYFYSQLDFLHQSVSYSDYYRVNTLIMEPNPGRDLFRYYFEENQFTYNTAHLGLFSFTGYEATPLAAYSVLGALDALSQYRLANIKYVVTTSPRETPGLTLARTVPPTTPDQVVISGVPDLLYWSPQSQHTHYIYQVDGFFPRFYSAAQVAPCPAAKWCLTADAVARRTVYTASGTQPVGEAEIILNDYTPNHIALHLQTDRPALIASSELYDTGWRASANGRSLDVFPCNGGFRCFIAPAGESQVSLDYLPPGLAAGAAVSSVSWLGLLLVAKTRLAG